MFEDLMENMDSDFRSFYGISNKLLTTISRFFSHTIPQCAFVEGQRSAQPTWETSNEVYNEGNNSLLNAIISF